MSRQATDTNNTLGDIRPNTGSVSFRYNIKTTKLRQGQGERTQVNTLLVLQGTPPQLKLLMYLDTQETRR